MCAWRQVPLVMLHHLLAAFVVNTAPGGFGVAFSWRVLGAFRIYFNNANNLQDSVIRYDECREGQRVIHCVPALVALAQGGKAGIYNEIFVI